jgi:selenide, water dikinase
MQTARLTSFSHGAGCACKLGPADLTAVLGSLGVSAKPADILVSEDTGDDAAVAVLPGSSKAIVFTTDFFTPIVDDPYDWGRIAATNAFSDVYAMGGEPAIGLNLAAWPVDDLPLEMLSEVTRGGRDATEACGAVVVGGHTITSTEPIFGMAAVGTVDPDRVIRNSGARPGDSLVLTKPIGTGLISTAIKRGVATDKQARAAVETMTAPNAAAARAMRSSQVSAATDVTGFGLLGHLRKLLEASEAAATVDAGVVPLLEGVLELAQRDVVAGGTKRNHAWLAPTTDWGGCSRPEQMVLADAQTSGGLLISTPEPYRLVQALAGERVMHARIGSVREGEPGSIAVAGRLNAAGERE